MKKRLLLCGATGFIGRNLLLHFGDKPEFEVFAVHHEKSAIKDSPRGVHWVQADLRDPQDVDRVVKGMDIVLQAAATTSGAKDILTQPHTHVTDNAVMNSYLFRACHEHRVGHVVFFSCTVMYPDGVVAPVKETDFNYHITDKYFAGGWTKVYLEKMCEFYAGLGATRYTAIRHSNVYGPFDKFDLERSHVFGATVAKVMAAAEGSNIVVWGDGSEKRDLLYVGDLVDFVDAAIRRQKDPFDLVNVGSGQAVSVRRLVEKVIAGSGKKLGIAFDKTKPTIPFQLCLNTDRARERYGWTCKTSLEEGIAKTLTWYRGDSRKG